MNEATSPKQHHLARWRFADYMREAWFPLRSLEFGGRIYEWIGIRAFYVMMANIAAEPVLPKIGEGKTDLSPEALTEFTSAARYHEWANIVLASSYIPGLVGGLIVPSLPYFWICFAMAMINVLCIWTERYKRAVSADLFKRGALGDQPIPRPVPADNSKQDAYFAPKPFESPERYEKIGVDIFRKGLLDGITACRYPPEERKEDARFFEKLDRTEILNFEATTRVNELIHFGGLVLHILLLVFFWGLDWALDLYMILMIVLDVYFVMLQRFHRTRIWKLVVRYRSRAPKERPAKVPETEPTGESEGSFR